MKRVFLCKVKLHLIADFIELKRKPERQQETWLVTILINV